MPPLHASSLPFPAASSLKVEKDAPRSHQTSKPNPGTNAPRTNPSPSDYFGITLSAIPKPILRALCPFASLNQYFLVAQAKRILQPRNIMPILLGSAVILAAGAALIHIAPRRA